MPYLTINEVIFIKQNSRFFLQRNYGSAKRLVFYEVKVLALRRSGHSPLERVNRGSHKNKAACLEKWPNYFFPSLISAATLAGTSS